jgi:hypothetical protein
MSKTLDGSNAFQDVSQIAFTAGSTVAHVQAIDGGIEYNFNLPLNAGNPGDVLTSAGGNADEMVWTPGGAGGSVTFVDVAVPAFQTSSGGPITSSGTITIGLSG